MKKTASENMSQDERSLLWSFCQAADTLAEKFRRLERAGSLSYSVLASIVGESSQKGLLWYVKDKAHTLFGESEQNDSPGALLDWSLGYIFHECVKLMEDTRLQQAYVVRLDNVTRLYPEHKHFYEQFSEIEKQTRRSIELESNRVTMLIQVSMDLFAEYFSGCVGHRSLARLLFDQEETFKRVFGSRYPHFLQSIYDGAMHLLYIEAGYSLLEAGKIDGARLALLKAQALSTDKEVELFAAQFERFT